MRALHLNHPDRVVVAGLVDDDARKPRLADPGFTADADDLALPCDDPEPSVAQQLGFGLAPDQRRQRRYARGLEPTCHATHTHDPPHRNRLGDTLEHVPAEVFIVEAAPGQAVNPAAHQNAAGLGHALQAGGEVHGVAHRALLGGGRHHDQTGRDPYAHQKMPNTGDVEPGERLHDQEGAANRPFGFVLMGQRVPEEGDDAIAQALEYKAFIADDASRASLFVAADHSLQHFGVHPVGQLGEAHHVAEHHRELSALAGQSGRA